MSRELLQCGIKPQIIAGKALEVYSDPRRVGPVVCRLMRKMVLYRSEAAWLIEHLGVAIVWRERPSGTLLPGLGLGGSSRAQALCSLAWGVMYIQDGFL